MALFKGVVIYVALVCAIHWGLTDGWQNQGMPDKLYDEDTPSLNGYGESVQKARNVGPQLQRDLDNRMRGR